MNNLFAYGTLMCPDIMQAVAGCLPPSIHGILRGYSRYRVKNESYPAIINSATGTVEGLLYRNVPPAAWERLDRFEGDQYERCAVRIETEQGAQIPAHTYVWKSALLKSLDIGEWNFDEFLRSGKNGFVKQYPGFRNTIT